MTPPQPPEDTDDLFDGNPDHAWKALGLIVDWVKHSETKAGAMYGIRGEWDEEEDRVVGPEPAITHPCSC